jgi:hypothetical protein
VDIGARRQAAPGGCSVARAPGPRQAEARCIARRALTLIEPPLTAMRLDDVAGEHQVYALPWGLVGKSGTNRLFGFDTPGSSSMIDTTALSASACQSIVTAPFCRAASPALA